MENDTYVEIGLQEYRRLCCLHTAAPKAIPFMYVMLVKRNENMTPDRAKYRIIALGNIKGRLSEKREKYAPVLQYSSLCLLASMATENCHVLKQGDCKKAFCNVRLPDDKTTIISPPPGNPDAKKDVFWLLKKILYGLDCSLRH